MVHRHPVELRSEVLLGLRHEPADHGLQVGIFGTIFRCDDEPELVAVSAATFEECLAVGTIEFGRIEPAALTFARGAVALEISQVRGCAIGALAAKSHEPRLDDHAPAAGAGMTVRSAEDPARCRPTSDAAAVKPSPPRTRAPDCSTTLIECLAELVAERSVLADPAEPEFEVIVGHHRALLPRLLEAGSSKFRKGTLIPSRRTS